MNTNVIVTALLALVIVVFIFVRQIIQRPVTQRNLLLPLIVITPPFETLPPVTFPLGVTVRPTPALDSVLSVVAFSAIVVLNPLAAKTSSETLARIV